MATFEKSIRIQADPKTVWDIVVDFPNMPRWFKGLRKITLPDAPRTGLGTRRWVSPGGPLVMKEVVTHWEEPTLFGYSVREGVPLKSHQGLIRIDENGPRSVTVTYSTTLETGLPLIGKLTDVGVGAVMNEVIGGALKELKRIAEKQRSKA
jgi:uncharacterized membrane protein